MAMTEPTLQSAPARNKREAAAWKRHEAEFFLPMLKQYDHGNSIEFRYVLNAFLAPVRTGHAFLRSAEPAPYQAWEAKLTIQDKEVLFIGRQARNLALHADGADIGQAETFSYIPTPGSYRHTFHLDRVDGTRVILPAVGVASRYLGLLTQALDGYHR
jgi:hypothetical protein